VVFGITGRIRSDRVRVAVIGAGPIANNMHLPSLSSFDDVDIVAICNIDLTRLNSTADKFGVEKRYTDYKRMVEEAAPDAVYAIGSPALHVRHLDVVLEQGSESMYRETYGHLHSSSACVGLSSCNERLH
jgi:predicted dehydrogenase